MFYGISGLEVLDALRRDRSSTELPMILATAITDGQRRRFEPRGRKSGHDKRD